MSDERTRIIGRPAFSKRGDTEQIPETEVIGSGKTEQPPRSSQFDADPETRLYRPERKPAQAADADQAPSASASSATADRMHDPVVGWLVIVDGPGKGHARELGYGMNSIGRSAEDRVSLDFGDQEISRHGHATVTYDPRGRRFYAQHGGGVNLSYIDDQPLLQPTVLNGGEVIALGNTRLKFIALCGPDFDWQDQ